MDHEVFYEVQGTWGYPCTISDGGKIIEPNWDDLVIVGEDGDAIWCETCKQYVLPGDGVHGLAEGWLTV